MTLLKIAIFLTVSSISLGAGQSCDDFTEGLCNFQGNDIGIVDTSDAEECQTNCRSEKIYVQICLWVGFTPTSISTSNTLKSKRAKKLQTEKLNEDLNCPIASKYVKSGA